MNWLINIFSDRFCHCFISDTKYISLSFICSYCFNGKIYLSIYYHIHLIVNEIIEICLSVVMCPVHSYFNLLISFSLCLSLSLSLALSVCLSVSLSVCLSLSLSYLDPITFKLHKERLDWAFLRDSLNVRLSSLVLWFRSSRSGAPLWFTLIYFTVFNP